MSQGKFEPINGKCYSGTGQSVVSMVEMMHHIGHNRKPIIFALYDTIDSENYAIKPDIFEAHNLFPGGYLQIGLALPLHNDQGLEALGTGVYDAGLIKLARTYKSTGLPIFLRIGYEFDGEWNGYAPKHFIRAYRHIVDVFRQEGVDNAAFVWNTYVCDNKEMVKWFPNDPESNQQDGEDYIDWFSYNTVTPKFEAGWFMEQAELHHKPVMIGEASYAILKEGITFEKWMDAFFSSIKQWGVKGYQYINWDWSVYPEVTNWLTWGCGRYTSDQEKIAYYNSFLDDYFIYRDHTYAQPVKLFVHCARGLKEADPDGVNWRKEKDHYSLEPGYHYEVFDAAMKYGDGWKPYWQSLNNHIRINITKPNKIEGYLILDLLDFQDEEQLVITVGEQTYPIYYKGHGYIKIPLNNIGHEAETIGVTIAHMNHKVVKLHQIGFVEAAKDIRVEDLCYEEQGETILLKWQGVGEAYTYNVYVNHWLYDMTDDLSYSLKPLAGGTVISVSPVSKTKGEGLLSHIQIKS